MKCRTDVSRIVAVGDGAGAAAPDAPGPLSLAAERARSKLMDLSDIDASAGDVVANQTDLAVALRPTTAFVSLGIADAARHLRPASAGCLGFMETLLEKTGDIVSRLHYAGASVVLIKPLALSSTPAAWRLFGNVTPEEPYEVSRPLLQLAWADQCWRAGLQVIATRYRARLIDFAGLFEMIVRHEGRIEGREVGLPPHAGAEDDLFADALHLSPFGASLAADLLGQKRWPARLPRRPAPLRAADAVVATR